MKTALLSKQGLCIKRFFTKPNENALDSIDYELRSCSIVEPDGRVVFEMKNIEVPTSWSQLATDIITSKYIRKAGVPHTGSEISARQVVFRISNSIRTFGEKHGYFTSAQDAENFEQEMAHLLITQKAAFNSPVWFNVGLWHHYGIGGTGGNWYTDLTDGELKETENAYSHPQCSACFIQYVNDDLMSIFDSVKSEARLFKYGSGSGTNFSTLRSQYEKLAGGGTSSGVMAFLEIFDRAAGSMKSGGTTRRAAKMVVLDMDHPEIKEFITWKQREEKKAKTLIAAGYPADFNGEAYHTVSGQNSNNSVRITDDFMNAFLTGGTWATRFRTTGEIHNQYSARELMKLISQAAWECADPGVQFHSIINKWHTCPNTGMIRASNPCSEYMFLDNTACNLSSINLVKFLDAQGNIDITAYRNAIRIMFIAQEILVDFSSYPTKPIAKNSHDYRPLGLGYANLGTLLMIQGIPYDSDKAFGTAAAITAILTGHAYRVSAELAAAHGAFNGFENNREPMLRIMNQHCEAAYKIDVRHCPQDLLNAAREDWDEAVTLGQEYGYRNSQATVLAPTGTIGLLMDCDTTGVEPDFSLIKYKKLAGGGYFKIVNQSVQRALIRLGYTQHQVAEIIDFMIGKSTLIGAPHLSKDKLLSMGYSEKEIGEAEESIQTTKSFNDWIPHINPKALRAKGLSDIHVKEITLYIEGAQTVEGAPHLKTEHVPIFDCANTCGIGKRFIDPMGHIKMMAAVQPFISGAISKTVNLPSDTSVGDIEKIYVESWKMGLKSVALYRDGCKASQPLSSTSSINTELPTTIPQELQRGWCKELPNRRKGITWKSNIGGQKVYIRSGEYEDNSLGEIFIDLHKQGAAYRSMMSCFAIAVSLGLQYGVPLEKFVNAFTFTRFEPNGMTDHPNVKTCTSIVDFIFRVIGMEYLGRTDFVHVKPTGLDELHTKPEPTQTREEINTMDKQLENMMGDAPACNECGHITVRNGSCYKCLNCGTSLGCS